MSSASSEFLDMLSSSRTPFLADGAMGTMLNAHGVPFTQCFDALNLSRPDLVLDIHRLYVQAGAQLILTNTFGANRYKLAAFGLQDQVAALNQSGVELARQATLASSQRIYVAGDVGPLGVRLAPFGRVQPDQARQAFLEQIAALASAGADLLILETFSDLSELCEAIAAARQVCDLPLVASMTFTRDDQTLLGDSPAAVVARLAEAGADLIGVNCSAGPAQVLRILQQMRQSARLSLQNGSLAFSAMPNAGWPQQVGGRMMYPADPQYFGEYALAFCRLGARLIGGCCGTTPQHIAAMRQALDSASQDCPPSVEEWGLPAESEVEIVAPAPSNPPPASASRLAQKLAAGRFVVAVEMDPPRGLSTHRLLAGASLLAEAGADVIDVADSPMARMRMSPWAVCARIQQDVGVETTLHFPTRGRNLLRLQGDLLAAHALGIRNIFVVMGDPTAIGDYPDAMDDYDLLPSGMIALIKNNFNLGKDHAGLDIGEPTSFFVGCALNLTPSDVEQEMKNLRRKIRAGADFILTQPVYHPPAAEAFLQRYRERYGPLNVPILVGVLPLYSPRHASFLHNEVPGVDIPEAMQRRLRQAGSDAPQEGVRLAVELIEQMKSWASGIYLMPQFYRFDLVAEIIEVCLSAFR